MRKVQMYIDLSSSDTGLTVLDVETNDVFLFSIKSDKFTKEKDKNQRALLKIRDIDNKIDSVLAEYDFEVREIFIEAPFCSKQFLNSSEMVLKMHGYILHKFKEVPFSFMTPLEIKKIVTGRGNATKEDVITAIRDMGYNLDIDGKANDNVYDSFAVLLSFYMENDKSLEGLNIHVN